MKRYSVLQITLDTTGVNACGSWEEAAKKYPEVEAHLAVTGRGSEGWDRSFIKVYKEVCRITCEGTDEAFAALNGYGKDDTVIVRRSLMHSLSVGDILRDMDTGQYIMVDPYGFSEVKV